MSTELAQISTGLMENDLDNLIARVAEMKKENPSIAVSRSQWVATAIEYFRGESKGNQVYLLRKYQNRRKRERKIFPLTPAAR